MKTLLSKLDIGIACIALMVLIIITFLGVERFPQRVQLILSLFIYAVVSFTLLYLGFKSSDMVAMFIRTNKSTSVLSIPSALIYGVIPVSAALMWINYTVPFLHSLKENLSRTKGERV
jgi:TRAP-type C4-dicarboxylate transport system permease small subunit